MTTKELETQERLLLWTALTRPTDTASGSSGDTCTSLQNVHDTTQGTDGLKEPFVVMEDVLQSNNNDLGISANGECDGVNMARAAEGNAAQELWDQDQELRALGISVVDQLTLERDVEAAVDKAVTQHTRKQRLQILKKEVKDTSMTVKQGENKLQDMKNRLTGMRRRVVDPRLYLGVEAEARTKAHEVNTLKARHKYLQQKLNAAEDNQEELDDYDLEEGEIPDDEGNGGEAMNGSERERLIREGQMTPFGTAMTSSKTVSTRPWPGLPSHVQKQGVGGESQRTKPVQKGPTKAELISSGEMTPFGTVVKPASSKTVISKRPVDKPAGEASDFEKYLQDQINRQKHHNELGKERKRKKSSGDPTYGVATKRRGKLKEYKGIFDDEAAAEGDSKDGTSLSSIKKKAKAGFVSSIKKSRVSPKSRKDPLKKRILHPKKRRKEKALGSVTSNLEIDLCKETPRRILSEMVSLEESEPEDFGMDGSGSEYVPSDQDDQEGSDEEAEMFVESEGIGGSPRKSNRVDKLEQKKKRQRKKDEAEWSDDNISVTKKKKSGKSRDDGNLEDYVKRIEAWKEERLQRKQEKILRGEDLDSEEEEEDGYEEFEGGFRVPLGIWNKLYKYQRTCVRWLWELHGQGCGGILGDEMGLGKTIEVIAFLVALSYSRLLSRHQHWRGLGPVLIVCPATVLHQWVKELHKWWPPFRVAVLHESGNFTGTRPALINNINRYSGILVTSYTGAKDQLETLLQYEWHYVILDEGHKIRNPEAQITVALKRFQTPHRIILSGSPIQNNLKELWSLFDFVFPGKLGTMPVFLQQFAVPITQGGYANASKLEVQTAFKCASMLRDTINPYLLRRMKNDVRNHLNLPDKNEQVLFCGLSEEQRKIYQEYISSDQVTRILGGRMKVFVGLINMRKICNHPDLFTGGPHGIDENWNSGLQPELRYGWWSRSGKMHVLRSVLQLWSRQEHRVLLFTQSRQMMCILERFLLDEKHSYLKMDGVTAVSSRQPLIDKFNQDPSYFVFLLTTRVGGLGVNLTGANRVVIFDPDWNPSTDTQARERAWRIGQLRHVTIYRLLTAGTIEEKIYHRQIFKQFLTNRVLKDPKQQRFFKSNDLFELFSFTEGEKEKTESSTIFAGTGSEIKLGEKRGEEEVKEEDEEEEVVENRKAYVVVNEKCRKPGQYMQNQVRTPKKESEGEHGNSVTEKERKSLKKSKEKATKNKTEGGDVSQSTSQMERMRELARKLSQKIGNKTSQQIAAKTDVKMIDDENISKNQKEDPNKEGEVKQSEEFSKGDDINTGNEHVIVKEEDKAEEVIKENSDSKSASDEEMLGKLTLKEECCNREMENKDSFGGKNLENDDATLENCLVVTEDIKIKAEPSISSQCSTSDLFSKAEPALLEDTSTSKRKHKKKDKDRDRDRHKENHKHKKGKKFEGTRIDYLVKKRNYRKTEEEEAAEKRNSKSQDEYVLDTLFKKSGVHTALSHDAILNTGDPDYLLVEGEAERVAKEALKAVRASRAYCARPCPSSDSHHKEKKHRFGKKKSKFFADGKAADEKKDKSLKEKKNKPMFNGGMNDDDDDDDDEDSKKLGGVKRGFTPFKNKKSTPEGSSGIITSSQLLSRMRQRNKGMGLDSDEDGEDGYDPDFPSTAPCIEREVEPEVQENIDLLADIRNFVAFQAEVDGKASTQEIIGRFRERLPPEQTPYFKALLTQICDFHREISGKGMWSLKGEFR